MRISLLGAGEIGGTVKKIAEEAGFKVLVRELAYDELDGKPVEALHVCIPYKDKKFIEFVRQAVADAPCGVVIIHSTVPPGVTLEVAKETKVPTAHSPVRGDHPNLYPSIKTYFIKYVGGADQKAAELAQKHLKKLGIKNVKIAGSSLDTELGKMVNILGYAWSIVFCKWVAQMCEEWGADFDIVYKQFTETYNEGYQKFRPNVAQPVLKSVPGPIGGHCVIPDTQLFDEVYKNDLTRFVLRKNKEYEKEKK